MRFILRLGISWECSCLCCGNFQTIDAYTHCLYVYACCFFSLLCSLLCCGNCHIQCLYMYAWCFLILLEHCVHSYVVATAIFNVCKCMLNAFLFLLEHPHIAAISIEQSTGRSGPALSQFYWPWLWPLRSGPPSNGPGPCLKNIHMQ